MINTICYNVIQYIIVYPTGARPSAGACRMARPGSPMIIITVMIIVVIIVVSNGNSNLIVSNGNSNSSNSNGNSNDKSSNSNGNSNNNSSNSNGNSHNSNSNSNSNSNKQKRIAKLEEQAHQLRLCYDNCIVVISIVIMTLVSEVGRIRLETSMRGFVSHKKLDVFVLPFSTVFRQSLIVVPFLLLLLLVVLLSNNYYLSLHYYLSLLFVLVLFIALVLLLYQYHSTTVLVLFLY